MSLNYNQNTYLAVTLTSSSPYFSSPSGLAALHPAVAHVGQVGELQDVQLVSVPKETWEQGGDQILAVLKGADGVVYVNVQEPRQRVKRGGDEL